MTRVFSAGVFDFFHEGHRFFLLSAKKLGDELFVVIARDKNVWKRKGFFPFFSEEKRKEKVQSSGIADTVLIGEMGDIFTVVEKIKPDILALGYDQNLPPSFEERFPHIKVIRLLAKNPKQWKSSVFREKMTKNTSQKTEEKTKKSQR